MNYQEEERVMDARHLRLLVERSKARLKKIEQMKKEFPNSPDATMALENMEKAFSPNYETQLIALNN